MRTRTTFFAAAALLAALAAGPVHADPPASSEPARPERKRESFEPQSRVAAKGQFGTVAPDDPAVKAAMDAKDLDGAKKLLGKTGAFIGTVSRVYSPSGNTILILDFDHDYKKAMTAVLRPAQYAKFPDVSRLEGKRVLVSGTFSEYKGAPQVPLTEPSQLRIVKAPEGN